MKICFSKYEGAGNDFIIFDARAKNSFLVDSLNQATIATLCHRRFGVGADGVIFLTDAPPEYDFTMRYHNSDGAQSSMCGNGGRCIARFAHDLGLAGDRKVFLADDGPHIATINSDDTISLSMIDVAGVKRIEDGYLVQTGSPHLVLVDTPFNLIPARALRQKHNCNVNYITFNHFNSINIRTFERGVEDETYACGTGAVAAAIVANRLGIKTDRHTICAKGGTLWVSFTKRSSHYIDVTLRGAAHKVFDGVLEI